MAFRITRLPRRHSSFSRLRRVEVGYADAGRAGRVLWIKVEAAE
jgi:hypothetical protein